MKRRFIFICGLLMSLSAFAQTSVTVTEPRWINPAEKVIIKEYKTNYPATVTCSSCENNGIPKATFIYSNAGMQADEVSIEGYYVNDMVVDGDSVFFCGRHIESKRGIVGYFKISDVFSGTGQINISSNFIAGQQGYPIVELTRLVHFSINNGQQSHLACIGICDEELKYPCLIDYYVDPFPVYEAGVVESNDEVFTDIEMVSTGMMYDDYHLVTAGFDLQFGRYINIRVYNPNNIFPTSGIQDWCHVFSVDTGYVSPWLDGGVQLVDVGDYTFATTSYRSSIKQKPEIPDTSILYKISRNIHLAFYKINTIISNSVYGMIDNYEIPYGGTLDCEMNQLIYSGSTNNLAFLHTYRHLLPSAIESDYCEVKRSALSSAGFFQAYNNPGIKQDGLSLYHYNNSYVLSGFDTVTPTTLKYQMNTFGVLSDCAEGKNYRYTRQNTIASWNFKRAFSVVFTVTNAIPVEYEINKWPLIIECEK